MSRRKQSNPKPLKLSSDVPSLKTENEEKMEASRESELSPESNSVKTNSEDSQEQTTPSPNGRITSPTSPDQPRGDNSQDFTQESTKQKMCDPETKTIKKEMNLDTPSPTTLSSLATQLQLPQDVLYLKRVEITMHGNTAVCWVVCCDIPLPKGSSLGPFQGEVTSADKVRVGDLILQFSGKHNPMLVNVTGQSGAWLALLRTATNSAVKNTCVHLEGDRIWCEVVSDLEKGSELIGSFVYHLENESPPTSPVPAPPPIPPPTQEDDIPKSDPPSTSSSSSKRSPTNHAALIFGCPFCNVRFSSPRTLQGHLAYYCSKKPPDLTEKPGDDREGDTDKHADNSENSQDSKSAMKSEPMDEDERSKVAKRHLDSETYERDQDSPPPKSLKSGQIFKCSHCSYTADKLSSLNRHRRIHNRPSEDSDESGSAPVPLSEMYCHDCNIQFSSLSTYRGHKEFYCNKRKSTERASDTPRKDSWDETMAVESSSSHSSPNSHQEEPVRNIFLPPGSLMSHPMIPGGSAATVIPAQTAVIFAAPVMAPSEMGITMPTVIVQPVIASPSVSSSASLSTESSISTMSKVPAVAHQKSSSSTQPTAACAEKPLDLSKKTPDTPDKDKSPERTPVKDSKLIINRSIIKEIPPLIKIEPKSPQKVPSSPRDLSKSPHNSSRSISPQGTPPISHNGSKSPDQLRGQRTSPYLPGIPPHFLPLALPGMPPAPALQSQSQSPIPTISKCADCNIVFYKHENYMIHKEHYCSGKKAKFASPPKSAESLKSPTTSPELTSPHKTEAPSPTDLRKEGSESKGDVPEDLYYRFFCVPCKIKFSSASTLKAHKEFYCPHGKDSGHSVVLQAGETQEQEEESASAAAPEVIDFRCDRCESVFTTSRLLKLHLCSGESTTMPLFRCPHCDYVTQTDTRLSDHMKVHAPTRAFRCSICGYRGNTVRGMRMHGKMHIDNGEEFTDDSMIEYEEPALMPIQTNGLMPHGPVDMEAELIRLKNEPYKRRRSRKSFEKSEYILSPSSLPQTHHCPVCRDTFPSLKFLNVHMRIHEITLKYQQDLMKCPLCSYVGKSKEDLVFHTKISHTTPQTSPSPPSPKRSPPPPQSHLEETVNIKREPTDMDYENGVEEVKNSRRSPSPSSPDKENVKTENIQEKSYTPKLDSPSGVRVSPYPRVSPKSHLSPLNTSVSPQVKSQPRTPDEASANDSGHEKLSPDLSRKDLTNGSGSHSIIFPTGPMFPYFLIPQTSVAAASVPPESTSPKIEKGPKYCKNCDISFTYLATFLAHKKYYCTAAKTTEEVSPSASA